MESIEIVFCVFWLLMIAAGAGYGLHALFEDTSLSRKGWALLGRVLLWLDDFIFVLAYGIHCGLNRLADRCECKADPGFNP